VTLTLPFSVPHVIPATQEAEISITVGSQPEQIVHKTLSRKYLTHKKSADGVAQGVGPEFKLQDEEKKRFQKVLLSLLLPSLALSSLLRHTVASVTS
jgi:hypothetical protein